MGNKWRNYVKGERVGEWSTTEFDTREAAKAFVDTSAPGTVVSEMPEHSTQSFERLTKQADGSVTSSRHVTCG